MRVLFQTTLGVMLLATVFGVWFLRRDYTRRNVEFLPGMVESVPYNAQDENRNFPDAKTLQVPPRSNEPQHYYPFHYLATAEDAKRAGEELVNPIPDTLALEIEKGSKIFSTFCSPCHGAGGLGDGKITLRGFPPPPSLMAEKARTIKDGQMFHIITYGQNNMPSLTSQVQREDRWRAILYVRSLQKKVVTLSNADSIALSVAVKNK